MNGENGMPFKAMKDGPQSYFNDVSKPERTGAPAHSELLNNCHFKEYLSTTFAVILYKPDLVRDSGNVWSLPAKDGIYEMNSLVALDGLMFDINATGSLKEFKLIAFANSSFTESVAIETEPAVNVEIEDMVENKGDGIFELEAVIILGALRSVLGPYTEDDDSATNVAVVGSFQDNVKELAPVDTNPTSMGMALPMVAFKITPVALVVTK